MTALGIQNRFDMETKAGGFIVQKGHPEKAQWFYEQTQFSPLVFEREITTPDGKDQSWGIARIF